MRDGEPTFETLRDLHIEALTGSLIAGVEPGPDGCGYAWSGGIPDPTLNFAFGVQDSGQFAWAQAAAHGRDRAPAFLARDAREVAALRALFEPAAVYPACWMVARPTGAATPGDARIRVHAAAEPPPEFERVFAHLSDDATVGAHLRRYYLPAFRAARARPPLAPLHLVLSDADGPAACASLYLSGDTAGLYNVSTRADRQRRGLGARVTMAALREAASRGARLAFLQCPAGGSVEALYARSGFGAAHAPTLLCACAP